MPFDMWQKQRDFLHWLDVRSEATEDALVEKSRDAGFTWLMVAWCWHKWRFVPGYDIAFGSRIMELVDKLGDPDAIFEKLRQFYRNLPRWLLPPGFDSSKHDNFGRLVNPDLGNIIKGQGGDNMGRGGRVKLYVVDEFAFVEHDEGVDAATSATSSWRVFGSTVNGTTNSFYRKRMKLPDRQIFMFDVLDDPRKDVEWVRKKKIELEPHIYASEFERNYSASVDRIIIPAEWLRACVGALKTLGIAQTGTRGAGFDVADEGRDMNAAAGGQGVQIDVSEQWSGKGSDIHASTEWVFGLADEHGWEWVRYDGDGVGADVRGAARVINVQREKAGRPPIMFLPYRGSAAVLNPEKEDVKGRKNKDYFANSKAQNWMALRGRARRTWMWVEQGVRCNPDELLSLSPDMANLNKLLTELSQPTYSVNGAGKVVVDKAPDGARSPNMADAVVIRMARRSGLIVPKGVDVNIERSDADMKANRAKAEFERRIFSGRVG